VGGEVFEFAPGTKVARCSSEYMQNRKNKMVGWTYHCLKSVAV